jgi:hypothetical protein
MLPKFWGNMLSLFSVWAELNMVIERNVDNTPTKLKVGDTHFDSEDVC